MTLTEIKTAVESGLKVHWANKGYEVVKDNIGQWLIVFRSSESAIGLTWDDGTTMNGMPEDFFIARQTTKETT